ncbi:hypothetical protein H6F50_15690 [Coleofasciculus sp. FACHB-712]|uniref:hypothetical protein n=1 Tax=unclassified Coleofasciculus TaxID=2692782 RepID=UPI001688A532|nr:MULTISPECIES: hypothetical protein [unclassified Coleofasciculus]MBD1943782.1 hypothetical protein [Coleofasciculus sp. FACHB-712]MBD2086219.1 hypothetical protein [Coleofasciculus sp. FACHB-542]
MKDIDPFENQDIKRDRLETPLYQLFIYLIPVVGFFPALWTLYRRDSNRQQQTVSRLSVTLALGWLLAYGLLGAGVAQASETLTLRLLFINGLLTSGYFLVSLWLMVRLWQRKSVRIPGVSGLAEGAVRKHLS